MERRKNPLSSPFELTEEEEQKLHRIRDHSGKGYIRDYCIKMVHICSNCGKAAGWTGPPTFTCASCGQYVTPKEWKNLPTEERWINLE